MVSGVGGSKVKDRQQLFIDSHTDPFACGEESFT